MAIELLAKNTGALPDIGALIAAGDPEERRAKLIKLGLTRFAERDYRTSIAGEYFGMMGSAESLYRWYYSKTVTDDGISTLPGDVIAILEIALDKKIFDRLAFWATEDGQEVMAFGIIDLKETNQTEYFMVARWGATEIITLEKISELKLVADTAVDSSKVTEAKRQRIERNRARFRSVFAAPLEAIRNYREAVVLAASVGMFAESISGSAWWLLPGGVLAIGSMISINRRWGKLQAKRYTREDEHYTYYTGRTDPIKIVTGWLIAASVAMFASVGILNLVDWEQAVHTKNVLVCKIGTGLGANSQGQDDTWIKGPQGAYDIQSGTYNGVHYYHGDVAAQTFRVGEALQITYHGAHMGPGYVTAATTLPAGSLGVCSQ
ncbi:MAG: hypothetical protein ACQR33_01920 [Candidatus Saccharibacteria bacterium]